MANVVKHLKRLLRESPSWKVFKKHVDVAFEDRV